MSTRTVRAHVLMTVFLVGFLLAPLTPHHTPPVAASGGLTRSSSPALSSCFRDDFTSTSLSPGWQFVDPLGDSNYHLSVHPSTLRVNAARGNHDFHYGYNTNAPRMMRQITGNFDVRTRVTTNPQYSYQSAGLTVWWSEHDFFWIGRAMYNLVQSLYEHSGQSGWWPTIKGVTATTIYLRIVRSDDTFSTYYSLDGSHWRSIGSTVYPAVSQSVDVGMFVLSNWQDNPFSADFDYFENVSQCSSAPAAPPARRPVKKVIVPGGVWESPTNNFTVRSDQLDFKVHAYPTHRGDPAISRVDFAALYHGAWHTACQQYGPSHADMYACTWKLTPSTVPNGPVMLSFDVYDNVGNHNLAPNGVRIITYPPSSSTRPPFVCLGGASCQGVPVPGALGNSIDEMNKKIEQINAKMRCGAAVVGKLLPEGEVLFTAVILSISEAEAISDASVRLKLLKELPKELVIRLGESLTDLIIPVSCLEAATARLSPGQTVLAERCLNDRKCTARLISDSKPWILSTLKA